MTPHPPADAQPSGLRARIRDVLRSSLARASGGTLLVLAGGSATSFVLQLVLARVLGATEYGVYLLVLGWMNVAVLLTRLDLDAVAVRFVAAYRATDQHALLHGLHRFGRLVAWGVSGLVGLGALVTLSVHDAGLSPGARAAAEAACLLLPITAALVIQGGFLQGWQRVAQSIATNQAIRPIVLLATVGTAVLALRLPLTAARVILFNVGASLVALAVGAFWMRPDEATVRATPPAFRRREWLRVALELVPITAAQLLLSMQMDILVVGSYLDTASAAHYGAAAQLASLVVLPAQAVLQVAMPRISELHVTEDRAGLQRILDQSLRLTLAAALLPALALGLGSGLVLGLYGASFRDATTPMLILLAAQVVSAAVGAQAGNVMVMTGRQRAAAVVIGGCALLNLLLAVVLTPRYGAAGTATATLVAVVTRSALLTGYLRRTLALDLLRLRG